jgi:hypothetical protein
MFWVSQIYQRHVMRIEQFIAGAKADLGDFVHESGVVLYSSASTLRAGDIYLLGINPGLDRAGKDGPDIKAHLDKFASQNTNSYLDSEWRPGRIGQHPFQLRVVWLLRSLGFDPREVCACNLIFRRSHGEHDCGYPATADSCWPVHQRILRIVQPKLIICVGRLPFDYIIARAGYRCAPREFPSGHGDWQCRAAQVQVEGHLTEVVYLPHFGRYNIVGKQDVVAWIREKLTVPPCMEPHAASVAPHTSSTPKPS